MKLTEIINEILVRTGEYIVATDYTQLAQLQLDIDKIWTMVRRELLDYQKYKPLKKEFNLTINSFIYRFNDDPHNGSNGPPSYISKCTPVGIVLAVTAPTSWMTPNSVRSFYNLQRTIEPQMFLWNYLRDWVDDQTGEHTGPILCVSQLGMLDIRAHYPYTYNVTTDKTTKKVTEVDIPELDSLALPLLFDMLSARFIQAVGRSRRAFTYQDLPVLTDADTLVKEGAEWYEKSRESLLNRHDWWTGIGV